MNRSLKRGAVLAIAIITASLAWRLLGGPGQAQDRPEKPPVRPGPAAIDAAAHPSLQAALDALPESGGVVRLPPGRHEIDRPLVLARSNARLQGCGAATCIVNRNAEGRAALVIQAPDFEKDPKARLWRVQVADLRICGDPEAVDAKSTSPKSGSGLVAHNVNEIFLHNVSIDHCGGHGASLVNCYEDPRVADSIFTYNGQAGLHLVGCHDIVVAANHFEENQDALHCIDSFNLCMTGNNLDDHRRHGVVIENTYGSVLSGNMIEECEETAVILDRDCYGITVSANVLADNFGGGVDLRDAWGCAVSANTFTIDAVRALVVGPQSGRITISGNNFSDSYIGGKTRREGKPNLATGIQLQGTRDVLVSGNVFSGLEGAAVRADERCVRINIRGNSVVGVQRSNSGRLPAVDLGGAADCVVKDNLVSQGDEPVEPNRPAEEAKKP